MGRLLPLVLIVFVAACGGSGPTADAGEDITVPVGSSPVFDGCGSDGDITNYRWTIVDAPGDMADDVGKDIRTESTECSFTLEAAMLVEEAGEWEIELTVQDTDGNTSTDTVSVMVDG